MLANKISLEFYHLDSTDSAGIIPSVQTSPRNNIPYLLASSPVSLMEHTFYGDRQDGDILQMKVWERFAQSDAQKVILYRRLLWIEQLEADAISLIEDTAQARIRSTF